MRLSIKIAFTKFISVGTNIVRGGEFLRTAESLTVKLKLEALQFSFIFQKNGLLTYSKLVMRQKASDTKRYAQGTLAVSKTDFPRFIKS